MAVLLNLYDYLTWGFSTLKCSVVLSEKQHGAVATLPRRTAPTSPTTVCKTLHNRIQGQLINAIGNMIYVVFGLCQCQRVHGPVSDPVSDQPIVVRLVTLD